MERAAVPKHEGNFLLISHGMSILRVPLLPKDRPAPGRPIYIQVFQAAVGGALSLRFCFFSVRLFDGCFFFCAQVSTSTATRAASTGAT